MEEQSIKQAAEEAVGDLELDCEVKEVCRSPNGEQWCVQFSGSYSQFCDEFQDQFDQENSPLVMREKVKRHLLKQVEKIRRSTGKARRPKTKPKDEAGVGNLLDAPLKMIGDVLGGASDLAGGFVQQAVGVADAARRTVSNMSTDTRPVAADELNGSIAEAETPRTTFKRKAAKRIRQTKSKSGKATRKSSKKVGTTAKKASTKKASAKKAESASRTKKAAAKKTARAVRHRRTSKKAKG